MLSKLNQDNYLTIKEYKQAISDICERLKICREWNEDQSMMKAEEAFYIRLSKRTQLEMSRLNVQNIGDIYNMINLTEETLLEQLESNTSDQFSKKSSIFKQKNEKHTKHKEHHKYPKHCSYHGDCNYYTSELM
ncbi:hypothetical protein DMUE_5038 [Dictyocoela muelleri]|nr:hypothetical protein DMUE_5038 [Dictyocoela muelleri]